jgi:succinate dehydrogenase / fumarate reductase flavoprotein subunit
MLISPAVHYTMGGLLVDYNLMTTIPGLFAIGECNFSDHGANRLGASALMQGLADGYFIIGTSIANYLSGTRLDYVTPQHVEFLEAQMHCHDRIQRLLSIGNKNSGQKITVDAIHRELGRLLWEHCGLSRNRSGLKQGLASLAQLREAFWNQVGIPGTGEALNQSLERAGRVADFFDCAEVMIHDALTREESCGCHLREESQTEGHEALRDDERCAHVSIWEYRGSDMPPIMHKEPLIFENVNPSRRSYG